MRSLTLFSLVCMMMALSSVHAAEHEVQITIGMNRDEAVALIKKRNGKDITAHVGFRRSGGDNPVAEVYWEFKNHDAVIEVRAKDGHLSEVTFWTKEDFGKSKIHRSETAQTIKTLTLDTKSGKVSVEKKERSLP